MIKSREEVWENLRSIIAELLFLEEDEVTPEDSLIVDLGIDSLDLIELGDIIKKEFKIDLSLENWMKTVIVLSEEITGNNVEEKIQELSVKTNLVLSEKIKDELKEKVVEGNQWDISRLIIESFKVSMLIDIIISKLEIKTA